MLLIFRRAQSAADRHIRRCADQLAADTHMMGIPWDLWCCSSLYKDRAGHLIQLTGAIRGPLNQPEAEEVFMAECLNLHPGVKALTLISTNVSNIARKMLSSTEITA